MASTYNVLNLVPTGGTWRVTAVKNGAGTNVTPYTSSALSTPITLPTAITTTTPMYLVSTNNFKLVLTVEYNGYSKTITVRPDPTRDLEVPLNPTLLTGAQQAATAFAAAPVPGYDATLNVLKASNCDPALVATTGSAAFTGGTTYNALIYVPGAVLATGVHLLTQAAGSGLTLAKVALYSFDGATRHAVTATQHTAFNTDTGGHEYAFASTVALSAGYYWGTILCVGTTGIKPYVLNTAGFGNQNLTGASLRWGTGATGLTDIATTLTPSGFSAYANEFYFGLY